MGTRGAGIGSVAGAAINFELDYTGSDFVANNASLYNGNIRHIVSQNKKLVRRELSYSLFRRGYFGGRRGARREDSRSYLTDEQRRIPPKEAELTVKNLVPGALVHGVLGCRFHWNHHA